MKSLLIFFYKMSSFILFVPPLFAIVGFLALPIYMKSAAERTDTENLWTDPSEELHQYAVKGDYLSFGLYRMGSGLPSAIGGGIAAGSGSVTVYKKKKKDLENIKKTNKRATAVSDRAS
jgi:hypothetical protein